MSLTTIIRQVATYSLGIIIGKLASILLLPIYTHFLTTTDYAVLELLEVSSSVLNTVTALHLSDALFYFFSKENDDRGRSSVLMTAYTGAILAGSIATVIGLFFSRQLSELVLSSPEYTPGFRVVAIYTLLGFVQELGFAHMRALNKSGRFLVFQIVRMFLQIALTVSFLVTFHGGYLCVSYASAITSGITAAYFLGEALVRYRALVRLTLLREMFRYTFPLGLSGGAMLLLHFGDRFFLERSVPLGQLGLYSLAYKIAMVVGLPQLAFLTYWKAQMFVLLREPGAERLYSRLFTYYMLTVTAGAVAIAAGAPPALLLLTRPAFHGAMIYIPLLTGAYVIRGAGDYWRSPLLSENRPGLNARVMLGTAAVCLTLYATLIPRYKAWGAVAATMGSFVCMSGWTYWQAQRVRYFDFEFGRLLRLSVSAALSLAVAGFLIPDTFLTQAGVSAVAVLVFVLGLLITRFFESEEQAGAILVVRSCVRRATVVLGSK